jgi:glycosyltransferase involved in cell wall biosynthesis
VLSKRDSAQDERLRELFARAHFLAMASRAEAYGIVFAEAAAFGVPSLATNVGGIRSAVADGASGKLFARDEFVSTAKREILACFSDYERYCAFAMSARQHYEMTVNWRVAAEKVVAILERVKRR